MSGLKRAPTRPDRCGRAAMRADKAPLTGLDRLALAASITGLLVVAPLLALDGEATGCTLLALVCAGTVGAVWTLGGGS